MCSPNIRPADNKMKITFTLKEDVRKPAGYLEDMALPGTLYYSAYFADVEILFDGQKKNLPNVPMIYFITVLPKLVIEALLTEKCAEAHLWDTGLKLSLAFDADKTLALEIPKGTPPLILPVAEFIMALRKVTLELLWAIYDDEPQLLTRNGLFSEGSVQYQAVQLMLAGKLARGKNE